MRLIDANRLGMYLADLQLSNAPDERDSEEVQRAMKSNYDFLEFLIKMLDKQPTVYDVDKVVEESKNNGWIPVSERLPEEGGYYLVTYHDWSDGNYLPKYDDTYVRRLHYQDSDDFKGWNVPMCVDKKAEQDCHKEVIAWQPLPEPYKAGETNE